MRARGPEALYQRCEMREAAHLSVAARGALEIQVCERVRARRVRRDAEVLEQRLADEMGRPAGGLPNPEIHAGLAKIRRQELRVDVGEVQQGDVAERWDIVELGGRLGRARARAQRRTCRSGKREQAQKFPSLPMSPDLPPRASLSKPSEWKFGPVIGAIIIL